MNEPARSQAGDAHGSADDPYPRLSEILRLLPRLPPDDVAGLVEIACGQASRFVSAVVFLADYRERVLTPLGRAAMSGSADVLSVEGTLAGRAYLAQSPVVDGDGLSVWVPLTNRWRRLGVLRVDLEPGSPGDATEVTGPAQDLATLLAMVIDSAADCTDRFHYAKRRTEMALTAEMQWELLPPMCIAGTGITLAGQLEPAYAVGGDAFDYAINGATAHVGIFDPLGHNLRAALLAALAVGTYRYARRSHTPLPDIGPLIDAAVKEQFPDSAYVTGQLGELDLASGTFTWTNAGHPLPLLLRDRQVHPIALGPDQPWGTGHRRSTIGHVDLQPGDLLLLYTDGITEARSPVKEPFGDERLADLLARESLGDHAAPELLRRLLRAVTEHRASDLADDATAVLIAWRGTEDHPSLGG